MRITLKLDAFDHAAQPAFAVLWIDRERGRWSREAHERVELPAWGTWESAREGTLLRDSGSITPLVLLHGLVLAALPKTTGVPREMQQGRAESLASRGSSSTPAKVFGHWHIQCIDCETTVPEHELFSDEEDAAPPAGLGFSAT
ncbi:MULTISPECIES: DUF3564 family protein [unclassified Caballeronia]|uniref:DUF3564 family protein n=1 Tax=unclassified Caballeronia TaxID=2646786 RepID=UPI002029A1A5|nr:MULTISPECIES: DUF3564 family protein [unclassified Caballeronia]